MITCSNCNHQNPEGSVQCESCYTPLPSSSPCPNCGALIQTNAIFCGQCGFNLQAQQGDSVQTPNSNLAIEDPNSDFFLEEDAVPTTINMNTFNSPWDSPEEEVENLSKIDDKQITFDEFMQLTAVDSAPYSGEVQSEPTTGQRQDLANDLNESEDLESWISSLQEESGLPNNDLTTGIPQQGIEELPDSFATPSNMNFVAESSTSQIDIPDVTNPRFAETEPTVEMPTGFTEPTIEMPTGFTEPASIFAEETIPEEKVPEEANSIANGLEVASTNEISSKLANKIEKEEKFVAPSVQYPEADKKSSNTAPVSNTASVSGYSGQTRLQLEKTVLYHIQTKTEIEIPLHLALIRIGKPSQQVSPDVDVSGFPNAEVVSRTHASIRVEGDAYFLEDMGSSNGTYINHSPLLAGNRHRLRSGDRFSLGKGDLMTFIFQHERSI